MNAAIALDSLDPIAASCAAVCEQHLATLTIDASEITSQRADRWVSQAKVQTTTEVLLLLARFHADVDDAAGASMLAKFAEQFAELEATVI